MVRAVAGPLVLAGFFLPWTHGPAPLAHIAFSGYDLVGTAGRLQELNLTPLQGGAVWVVRLAIVAVAVAAVWHSLLAVGLHGHILYVVSGWYLTLGAATALVVGIARSGPVIPPVGLALWAAGGLCFVVGEVSQVVATRWRRA
jgi:hypothetical protein